MSLERMSWGHRKRQTQSKLFGRNIVRLSREKGSRFYLENSQNERKRVREIERDTERESVCDKEREVYVYIQRKIVCERERDTERDSVF
jgi:hypothetical protein